MTALVMEAALRSLLLALAVWAALRVFRVRNVEAEKAAWTLVLAAAVAMPLLVAGLRSQRFPVPKFVLPARMTPRAIETPGQTAMAALEAAPAPATMSMSMSTRADAASRPAMASGPAPSAARSATIGRLARQRAESSTMSPAPTVRNFVSESFAFKNFVFEKFKAAVPAARKAAPISFAMWAAVFYLLVAGALCLRLFVGLAVSVRMWWTAEPVSGTALKLAEGLRLRASGELSTPVTIGSGVLLPAEYSTWKEEKLRIVLAHERSHVRQRDFYLQLLASLYAALLWMSPLGWWLKRKLSDLSEAIGDRSGLEEAASRTSYAQVLLEFAAAPRPTLIGVAMARPSSLARRMERLFNDSAFRQAFAGSRRTLVAALLAPAVLFAVSALVRVEAASVVVQQSSLTASLASGMAPQGAQTPKPSPATPAAEVHGAPPALDGPVSTEEMATVSPRGHCGHAMVEAASVETNAEFDRTLNFSGKLELHVGNASGNIHLTRGAGNQVHIHGEVRSEDADEADKVHAIAANPPIVQDGNVIRIGREHQEGDNESHTNHISIDYEIEAPADTVLEAASGSGNIVDQGVGQGAKLSTGSGNIEATGLEGGFKTETGSGNIAIDEAGDGDAKAETGSGNIEVKGVHGALKAETGSGNITAAGTPSSPWKIETGSGSVEFSPGSAPLNLNASTGSGSISSDKPVAIPVSSDGRKMSGQLNGGGPEVQISTGSGDIRIKD
jgi:beta-lactamase regulating signal transducer with metallopeptidase domain